jgi:hypothetical protein
MVPLVEEALKNRNGRTRARFRADVKISKFVLVSSSGWWEMGNFGTVLRIVKELAKDVNVGFAGALLRPHAGFLAENKEKADKIFAAARQAGCQLIKEGRISKGLLRIICQPLVSQERCLRLQSV